MIAENGFKELENSAVALTVTVGAEKLEKAYNEKLKEYASKIQLKGFRTGKAPVSVVQSKFGPSIREEVSFQVMEEELQEVIKTLDNEKQPLPFCVPVLQDEETLVPFKVNSDITFTVNYDVLPKVELDAYSGLDVSYVAAEVKEEDIDGVVAEYREQNSIVRTKDGEIADGDIVTLSYVELDEESNEIESSKRDDFTFTVGSSFNYYKIDQDVIGLKAEEEKVFDKTYAADEESPALSGQTKKIKVVISAVKVKELPEVDNEFAQDINEKYTSVEELRAGIKADLEEKSSKMMENVKIEALADVLIEKNAFTIPQSMIKFQLDSYWRNYVKQTGLSEEDITKYLSFSGMNKESLTDSWKADCEKHLKRDLIFQAIQTKENFEVSDEEVKKIIDERFNGQNGDDDYNKKLATDELQFNCVIPYLLEKNTFKASETLSWKEFAEKNQVR